MPRCLKSGLAGGAGARRPTYFGAYQAADPELVAGRRVLLIDDGSPLAHIPECARTLRTAGAADVLCATLARIPDKSGLPPPSFEIEVEMRRNTRYNK